MQKPAGILHSLYIAPLHMLDQSSWHTLALISPMLILLLALLAPATVAGCNEGGVDRQFILARVKAHILESIGPAPQGDRAQVRRRVLHRRHVSGISNAQNWEEEDTSQVIAFPSRGKRTYYLGLLQQVKKKAVWWYLKDQPIFCGMSFLLLEPILAAILRALS